MNCESVHFFGCPIVKRSHLPRHDGAANALQRVFRPGKPSPRQRNFGESSCIDELSVISSGSESFCSASRSHRITTRSPKSMNENKHFWLNVFEISMEFFFANIFNNLNETKKETLPSANLLYGGSLWHALDALMTSNSTQYLKLEQWNWKINYWWYVNWSTINAWWSNRQFCWKSNLCISLLELQKKSIQRFHIEFIEQALILILLWIEENNANEFIVIQFLRQSLSFRVQHIFQVKYSASVSSYS